MKKILKAAIKKPLKLVNFKTGEEDLVKMKKNAEKYYGGNLSGWIKYSAVNYHPGKSELTTVKA